jgi:hypothetical protein
MSEAQTSMAYRLIADFAIGITGEPQGLTPAELRRAWLARYGAQPCRRAYAVLSEDLLVRTLPRRVCAVTGVHVHPYVPSTLESSSW